MRALSLSLSFSLSLSLSVCVCLGFFVLVFGLGDLDLMHSYFLSPAHRVDKKRGTL